MPSPVDNTIHFPRSWASSPVDNTIPFPRSWASSPVSNTIPFPRSWASSPVDNTIPFPRSWASRALWIIFISFLSQPSQEHCGRKYLYLCEARNYIVKACRSDTICWLESSNLGSVGTAELSWPSDDSVIQQLIYISLQLQRQTTVSCEMATLPEYLVKTLWTFFENFV